MPTYTLVRESDGVPVALLSALEEETVQQNVQEGLTAVEGNWLGRYRMVNGKMVESERDFEELKVQLQWRILDKFTIESGEPVQAVEGKVRTDDHSVQLLLLGASSAHGEYFRFDDGTTRFLLQDQFARICSVVYNYLIDNRDKQERLLLQIKKAQTREELQPILDEYWPEENSS